MGVREAGLGVGVVLGLERLGDPDERLAGRRVDAFLAQQDAAQLDRRVAERVPFDGVGGPAIEEDRQVDRCPGPRRPRQANLRSRSGARSRSGSRTFISPKDDVVAAQRL